MSTHPTAVADVRPRSYEKTKLGAKTSQSEQLEREDDVLTNQEEALAAKSEAQRLGRTAADVKAKRKSG
jgi:hypothetical protein